MTNIEAAWQGIGAWLEQNAPEVAAGLGDGATKEQIAAAERKLGIALPEEVQASYSIHDGQQTDPSLGGVVGGIFVPGGDFLSLARIIDEWTVWKDLLNSGTFDGIQSDPQPGIKSDW